MLGSAPCLSPCQARSLGTLSPWESVAGARGTNCRDQGLILLTPSSRLLLPTGTPRLLPWVAGEPRHPHQTSKAFGPLRMQTDALWVLAQTTRPSAALGHLQSGCGEQSCSAAAVLS